MSDPNRDGPYTCHGDMMHVELPEVYDGTSAYLCLTCGCWRHRWPRTHTRRREQVEALMPQIIAAHLAGSRGDVA